MWLFITHHVLKCRCDMSQAFLFIKMSRHMVVENLNMTWQDNAKSSGMLNVGTQAANAAFAEIESDSLPKKCRIS